VENVARYLVEDGKSITIQPSPGVSDDEIRLFLQSAVLSALLLQRGLLPLHGSAVMMNGRAVILVGHSGNGKSTLAAALMERGYPFIADELCAVEVQENQPPILLPGFPQLFLWADTLRKMGIDKQALATVRPGLEKYILPCSHLPDSEPFPLRRVYILAVHNQPSFDLIPLKGVQNIHALIDWTYQVHHVAGMGMSKLHLKLCALAARYIVVNRIERPEIPFDVESLVNLIQEDGLC
jgi:hypothetical protein